MKASPSGKESIIKDEGVPFATLLWLRGHITLYIGEYKGEPVMFHNVWGVRTDDGNGEGRHIIGRAVVTSLQPGAELPNVRRENLILSRLKGMTFCGMIEECGEKAPEGVPFRGRSFRKAFLESVTWFLL